MPNKAEQRVVGWGLAEGGGHKRGKRAQRDGKSAASERQNGEQEDREGSKDLRVSLHHSLDPNLH